MTSPNSGLPDANDLLRERLGMGPAPQGRQTPSSSDEIRYDDAFYDGDSWVEPERGAPAPLTVIPTSTSNPARPRTLAAGYSFPTQTMTVLFRDGVLYNYYDIDMKTWQAFRGAFSKGVWLRENLEANRNGEVVTGGGDAIADAIVARAQSLQRSQRGMQRSRLFERDKKKLSGFQNKVLKLVDNGNGMRTGDAITAAKAELARVRREAAARRAQP